MKSSRTLRRGANESGCRSAWSRTHLEFRHWRCAGIAIRTRQRLRPAAILTDIRPPQGIPFVCASHVSPRESSAGDAPILPRLSVPTLPTGRVIRAQISPLALRHELGGDALREGSERSPVIGLLHVSEHEVKHGQEVGQVTQGVGYVVAN